jgi:hypothetical protein
MNDLRKETLQYLGIAVGAWSALVVVFSLVLLVAAKAFGASTPSMESPGADGAKAPTLTTPKAGQSSTRAPGGESI